MNTAAGPRACPGCAAPMRRESFARKPLGTLDLDLCFDCQAIWFDAFESPQLAPGAVLALFREIESQAAHTVHALAPAMQCVACRKRLVLTHDIERTNRIVYYRCPDGHGRFTTFLQFLREKEFVRSLTMPEVRQLSATIAQVRCSSCGAPVDIARDAECPFCHAPISILDADAVQRTIEALGEEEKRAAKIDAGAVLDALRAGPPAGSEPVDLIHSAIRLLARSSQESP